MIASAALPLAPDPLRVKTIGMEPFVAELLLAVGSGRWTWEAEDQTDEVKGVARQIQ